ncbi:hypothetical protein AN216_04460 [Streptomyces oceani]|uniref:WD40 repeat domain-containing protein n=1 Tax=Streptomyces oceani TaxID=1075402 RepID=A0A1E7KMA0_9ACTN|nr:hypothetical protein AN216_04460 [Streptomyces oceani]
MVGGLLVLAVAAPFGTPGAAAVPRAAGDRTPEEFTVRDSRITEASGLVASQRHEGVYWTHNDSPPCADGDSCPAQPDVYAVDAETGKTVATVTLSGVTPRDAEAISLGPDGNLYLGDIGDNTGGGWSEVWLYRFPEPTKLGEVTVTPTRYTVRYADGPRDAESLMVHPRTGRAYLASKEKNDQGGVYAGPRELSASGVNTFRRIADTEMWATDGAFSPDGTRLVLRSYFGAEMYRWTGASDGDSGSPSEEPSGGEEKGDGGRPKPIDTVPVPMQRQGESVTFTPDGRALMFGTEGVSEVVKPTELEDDVLPERAAKQKRAEERRGGGSDGDEDSALPRAAATFVLAMIVWMGLRRLFRRRE